MSTVPLLYRWSGQAMEVLPRFAKAADATFVVGQVYKMEALEERSARSHSHFFAALHEAFMSLPDDYAERFPTEDHLRRYALIKCGFADCRQLVASSKAEAQRLGAFVKPCDEYAIVTVKDCVVTVWTARSQSLKAMGKLDFAASKNAVLEYVFGLIGAQVPQAKARAA